MLRASVVFVLAFLDCTFSAAQNLVPNPSFECGKDQCDFTISSRFVEGAGIACYWSVPTLGTSDFFSTVIPNKYCWASMPPLGVYYNPETPYIGSQLPRTGNRFAGFFTFGKDFDNTNMRDTSYREYLQIRLTEPLVPERYYCGEMYVSLAEEPSNAANNLGMCFYNQKIEDYSNFHAIPYIPQIIEKNVILDSDSWVRVYGSFKLDSSVEYLSIGNFYNDNETIATDKFGNPTPYSRDRAYYFVDDVSVTAVDLKPLNSSGSTICSGSLAVISAKEGFENIVWTTLADTSVVIGTGPLLNIRPETTTTYRITAKNCKLTVRDTLTIRVNPSPQVNLGRDTTICEGDSLILDAKHGYTGYLWQDNSKEQRLVARESGQYAVKVENEYGCGAQAAINISVKSAPRVDIGRDTLVCNNVFYPLIAGGNYENYEWSTGATDSSYTPISAGEYWVKVKNQCGVAGDTIAIRSLGELMIPNVLTLNSDDTLNRYFKVLGVGPNDFGRLTLFNRWGQEIYSSNNYQNDWPKDPTKVSSETYYYTLDYSHCPTRKGWVSIIK
jgi:CHU_C Type IX secretion signal domain